MAIEVSVPFQPQHEDAEIILERCMEEPLPAFFWAMYDAGGFTPCDTPKIMQRLKESAAKLLTELTGVQHSVTPLPL